MYSRVERSVGPVACGTIAHESPVVQGLRLPSVVGLVGVQVRQSHLLIRVDVATGVDRDSVKVVDGPVHVLAVGQAGVVEPTGFEIQRAV